MKFAPFFLLLVALSFKTQAAPAFPKAIPCFGKLTAFLDKLGVVEKWLPYPGGVGGKISGLGSVELYHDAKTTLVHSKTNSTLTRIRWTEPKCEEQILSIEKHVTGFTDLDLSNLLTTNTSGGFVYIWSPHMTLSVDEVATLKDLKTNFPFTVVLDPKADMKLAQELAKKHKMPDSYLIPMDSYVLQQADIMIHFPAIVFYKDGKILKRIPGHSGSGLSDLVKENLK